MIKIQENNIHIIVFFTNVASKWHGILLMENNCILRNIVQTRSITSYFEVTFVFLLKLYLSYYEYFTLFSCILSMIMLYYNIT